MEIREKRYLRKYIKAFFGICLLILLCVTQMFPVSASYAGASGSFNGWENVSNQQRYFTTAEHLETVLKKEGYMTDIQVLYPEDGVATTEHGPNGATGWVMVRLEQEWTHEPIVGQYMSFRVFGYKDYVIFSIETGDDPVGYHWKYDWTGRQLTYGEENAVSADVSIGEFVYRRFTNDSVSSNPNNQTGGYAEIPQGTQDSQNVQQPQKPEDVQKPSDEDIKFSLEDTYSFVNDASTFYNSEDKWNYNYISDGDLMALHAYVNKYFANSPQMADGYCNLYRSMRFKPWFECCYGIAATEVLNYYGALDVARNFCNGASNIREVGKPKDHTDLRSMLFTYHLTQFLPRFAVNEYGLAGLEIAAKEGPVLLAYEYPGTTDGHAVVAYGVEYLSTGGSAISIYDSEVPDQILKCIIHPDYMSCEMETSHGTYTIPDEKIQFLHDVSQLAYIDLDGSANDGMVSVSNIGPSEGGTFLFVRAQNHYTITDAEGYTLIYDNGELSCTMDVKSVDKVFGAGVDGQTMHIYELGESASYTYRSDCEEDEISMVSSDAFTSITAKNASQITLMSDGKANMLGDRVDFFATLTTTNGTVDIEGYGMGDILFSEEFDRYVGATGGGDVTSITHYENANTSYLMNAGDENTDMYDGLSSNSNTTSNSDADGIICVVTGIVLIAGIVFLIKKTSRRRQR